MAKPNVISRQELLQSARQVIASHGMQALTLKAVAEGAGVTQGTVYYHFRNKEQLLLELIKEMCQDSWHDLLADAAKAKPFWKRRSLPPGAAVPMILRIIASISP